MKDIQIYSGSRADYALATYAQKLIPGSWISSYYNEGSEATLVIGDRFDTMYFAINSIEDGVPVIHMHGGEITRGSMDEYFRHAITKLSFLHLTATEEARQRVISMGENPGMAHNIGAIGAWEAANHKVSDTPAEYDIVACYHPDTIGGRTEEEVFAFAEALRVFEDERILILGPNEDPGHEIVRDVLMNTVNQHITYMSHHSDYFDICAKAKVCVGNSSSFIIEVPSLKTPVVLVGNRQNGRERISSVIKTRLFVSEIVESIKEALDTGELVRIFHDQMRNPYYMLNTPELLADIIKRTKPKFKKDFYEDHLRSTR